MKQTVNDVLRMAGHLLADPERHQLFRHAGDMTGGYVLPNSPAACKWCVMGALQIAFLALDGKARVTEVDDAGLRKWKRVRAAAARVVNGSPTVAAAEQTIADWNHGTEDERLAIAAKLRAV